jgi:hypothetical protein
MLSNQPKPTKKFMRTFAYIKSGCELLWYVMAPFLKQLISKACVKTFH